MEEKEEGSPTPEEDRVEEKKEGPSTSTLAAEPEGPSTAAEREGPGGGGRAPVNWRWPETLPFLKKLLLRIPRLSPRPAVETVAWDVDCSAHPLLRELMDTFRDLLQATEIPDEAIQARYLARAPEQAHAHISAAPLRSDCRRYFLSLEVQRPPEQERVRDIGMDGWHYAFGKFRISREHYTRVWDARLSPLLAQLGVPRMSFNGSTRSSGQFFYPPGGFREWHTNVYDGLNTHTWRGYIVLCDKDGQSALNVMNGDRMVHCADKTGIIRFFKVGGPSDPLWHSVESNCNRFSLGFRLPDHVVQRLLPLATTKWGV